MAVATDYVIANGTGTSVLADLNAVFGAIVTNNSDATEPPNRYPYMLWADTSDASAGGQKLRIRNSGNDAWITLFSLAGGVDVDAASNFNADVTFTGASANIGFDKSDNHLEFADSAKAVFGNSDDLQIYHDGTHSRIDNNTNALLLQTDSHSIQLNKGQSANMLIANVDGAVEIFHNNSKKFETTSAGATVTGTATATTFSGSGASLTSLNASNISSGTLAAARVGNLAASKITSGTFDAARIPTLNQNTTGTSGGFTAGNASNLNSGTIPDARFPSVLPAISGINLTDIPAGGNSFSQDITFNGDAYNMVWDKSDNALEFADNAKAKFGSSEDLQIYHDGTHSYLKNTGGNIVLQGNGTNSIVLQSVVGENAIICNANTSVELFYDASKKLETASNGIQLLDELGINDNKAAMFGDGDDMKIYHDGSDSFIANTTGALKVSSPGNINLDKSDGSDHLARFIPDGAVELYYDGSKKFETTSAGATLTGNLSMPSGNGIDFSAVSDVGRSVSTDGNKLDDYEEGTWTPDLRFGGSNSGITYGSCREGSYTKIGRQVTVNFGFNLTDKGSQSGAATIRGLPYNPVSIISGTSIEANGIVSWWNQVDPNIINIVLSADDADDELNIRLAAAAVDSPTTMTNTYFQNDTELRGSITYFVAT